MDKDQLKQYLDRIGIYEILEPSLENLGRIQRAHLETVPFENLDILEKAGPLSLDEASLFDKIVGHTRGGICYELNFLYTEALRALGYKAQLVGARIYDSGSEFDHVTILVEDPDDPSNDPWLTDVGFAYNFAAPLKFKSGIIQNDGRMDYRIDEEEIDGETWYKLIRLHPGEDDERMFVFRDVYRDPEEFVPMATFFATDDSSRFRKGPLVCIDGDEGRITLSMRRFIETRDGVRTEREIDFPDEFNEMLTTVFKMKMD